MRVSFCVTYTWHCRSLANPLVLLLMYSQKWDGQVSKRMLASFCAVCACSSPLHLFRVHQLDIQMVHLASFHTMPFMQSWCIFGIGQIGSHMRTHCSSCIHPRETIKFCSAHKSLCGTLWYDCSENYGKSSYDSASS
jgi:hypothetical protein